jgi:hypothetical protein
VIQPADRHPLVEAGVEADRLLALYAYTHLDAGAREDRLAVTGVGTRLERAVERGSARRLTGPAQRRLTHIN